MDTICFSSWNGRTIDNRKGKKAPGKLQGVAAALNGSPYRALMGWNGLVVADGSADVPSLAWAYLRAARRLSCGECSVCMIGIDRLLDIFGSWSAGCGGKEDLAEIAGIVTNVSTSAKCNYGGSSLSALADAIEGYRGDFLAVIAGQGSSRSSQFRQSSTPRACTAARRGWTYRDTSGRSKTAGSWRRSTSCASAAFCRG